jgi:hypothetical protein
MKIICDNCSCYCDVDTVCNNCGYELDYDGILYVNVYLVKWSFGGSEYVVKEPVESHAGHGIRNVLLIKNRLSKKYLGDAFQVLIEGHYGKEQRIIS